MGGDKDTRRTKGEIELEHSEVSALECLRGHEG